MNRIHAPKSCTWKILFTLFIVLLAVFKLWIFVQDNTFTRFTSDTQRHLFLYQDIYHHEVIPRHPIRSYVAYPEGLGMGELNYYPRGGHVWGVMFSKITGLDILYAINLMGFLLLFGATGMTYSLSRLMFKKDRGISILSSLFFFSVVYLFNVTPHYLVAYILIPGLVYTFIDYLAHGQRAMLALFTIMGLTVNLMHSNFGFLFLIVLTLYAFFEERGEKGDQVHQNFLNRVNACVFIYTTLFIAVMVQSFFYLDIPAHGRRGFVSEYTGAWSIAASNDMAVWIALFGIGLLYSYMLYRVNNKKKQKNWAHLRKWVESFTSRLKFRTHHQLWNLFMLLVFVLILSPVFSGAFIEALAGKNIDLSRTEHYPFLILFAIGLFGLFNKEFEKMPRFLLWAYLPLSALVLISVVLLNTPLNPFVRDIIGVTFPVLDFSLVFLALIAGSSLAQLIKRFSFRETVVSLTLIFIALNQFSMLGMYENSYNRSNFQVPVIEAYFWLKPQLSPEVKVGSNFEYMRSVTWIEKRAMVPTMVRKDLQKIRLDDFVLKSGVDYFIHVPWIDFFPDERWAREMARHRNIRRIYAKDGVKIYKILKDSPAS